LGQELVPEKRIPYTIYYLGGMDLVINPQASLKIAMRIAENTKASDVVVLDISKISVIADNFLICTGRSTVHTKAIAREIVEKIEAYLGVRPRIEGLREGLWILLDYGDLVVHIFMEEQRQFYNLERLWGYAGEFDSA
jgi:ribosome-associated protein